MKCLCCNPSFEDQNSLRERYVTQHGVDENSYFFKKLITKDRFFTPRKCFHWKHFCLKRRDEKNHNLLAHCPVGENSIERRYFDEKLQRFCINISQHGDHYNFSDSQGLASDFLTVFENVFIPQPNHSRVRFKCSFKIINRQPAPRAGFLEVTDSRTGRQMSMKVFISMNM